MHRTAYALLLLTTLFWGGNAIAGKLAVGHVSPMLLATARWSLAFAVLALFSWPRVKHDWAKIRPSLPLLAALGAAGFAGFNLALYSALNYTSAINTTIEQAGVPMLIFLANFVLFRIRVSLAQIVGLILTFGGIALTASHGDPLRLLRLDLNFGDALMLVAIVVYAGYTVALRFKPDIHWQSLMTVMTGAAALTSIPFAIAEFQYGAGIVPDGRGWAIIGYTVIFPSILSQVLYIRGVEMIGGNRAGLFINLVPIYGALLSITILGEPFNAYHGLAMVMVFGGIWLAEHSGRRLVAPGSPGPGV